MCKKIAKNPYKRFFFSALFLFASFSFIQREFAFAAAT